MTAELHKNPDYTKWRAALIEYEHVGVYSCRSIHVEATPLRLLREVAPCVLDSAEVLVNAFWECLDDEILGLLFDPDGECPLFEECHYRGDVVPLLRQMAVAHELQLANGPSDASILGKWYEQVRFINDVWLCDDGSFIRISLESDARTFTKCLLEREARRFDPRLVLVTTDEEQFQGVGDIRNVWELNDGAAIDLGQLAVLAHAPDWQWRNRATIGAFWKWVERFNADNEG